MVLKIRRGDKYSKEFYSQVPKEGELCYLLDTKELVCGDGELPVSQLNPVGCVAKSPNGRLFYVEVDDDGNAKATPLIVTRKKPEQTFELYGE